MILSLHEFRFPEWQSRMGRPGGDKCRMLFPIRKGLFYLLEQQLSTASKNSASEIRLPALKTWCPHSAAVRPPQGGHQALVSACYGPYSLALVRIPYTVDY